MQSNHPTVGSLCAQCKHAPAKYTCPRCSLKTCSLACSRAHKTDTGCSGQRDRAAYVPMNEYGYGKLMDDYRYLEDGRRKVEQWGKGIKEHKMTTATQVGGQLRKGALTVLPVGEGSARIRKMQALQDELARRDIEVEFLPDGMERRSRNQSSFNPKSRLVQLSIQVTTILPTNAKDTTSGPALQQTDHYIPRVPLQPSTTLHSIMEDAKIPLPSPSSSDSSVIFTIPIQLSSHLTLDHLSRRSTARARPYYPPLDGAAPLEDQLRHKGFIEYPTVEVVQRTEWERRLNEGETVIIERNDDDELDEVDDDGDGVLGGDGRQRDSGWGDRANVGQINQINLADETASALPTVGPPRDAVPVPQVVAADKLQSFLGDYGSDSDEEEGDDDKVGQEDGKSVPSG